MTPERRGELSDIAELLKRSFITCNSGHGNYYIRLDFNNLTDAHEIHRALIKVRDAVGENNEQS